MSLKKNNSYTNSLSTIRFSCSKNIQSDVPFISFKKKNKPVFNLMSCFCLPSNPANKNEQKSHAKLKTESQDATTNYNNTSLFMENSKQNDESLAKTMNLQVLKTESHIVSNEILTPVATKSKTNGHFNLKLSQFMKKKRSEENLAKIILSNFPKNQIYFLKSDEKNYFLGRNKHIDFKNFQDCAHHQSENNFLFFLK